MHHLLQAGFLNYTLAVIYFKYILTDQTTAYIMTDKILWNLEALWDFNRPDTMPYNSWDDDICSKSNKLCHDFQWLTKNRYSQFACHHFMHKLSPSQEPMIDVDGSKILYVWVKSSVTRSRWWMACQNAIVIAKSENPSVLNLKSKSTPSLREWAIGYPMQVFWMKWTILLWRYILCLRRRGLQVLLHIFYTNPMCLSDFLLDMGLLYTGIFKTWYFCKNYDYLVVLLGSQKPCWNCWELEAISKDHYIFNIKPRPPADAELNLSKHVSSLSDELYYLAYNELSEG